MTKTEAAKVERIFEVEFDDVSKLVGAVHGLRSDLIAASRYPSAQVEMEFAKATCSAYIAALPMMLEAACHHAAEALLDRSKFASDREYSDAVQSLAGKLQPVGACYAGDEGRKRYAVEATYENDGGPFGDSVNAKDEAEAEFMIRWTMTENQRFLLEENGAEAFADAMTAHSIRDIDLEPVSFPEAKKILADLIREAQAAGHSGPALDAARETAEALGLDVGTAPAPGM